LPLLLAANLLMPLRRMLLLKLMLHLLLQWLLLLLLLLLPLLLLLHLHLPTRNNSARLQRRNKKADLRVGFFSSRGQIPAKRGLTPKQLLGHHSPIKP
jgi:uncharacterized SAM-binding protein YcdF (DUF218 family)